MFIKKIKASSKKTILMLALFFLFGVVAENVIFADEDYDAEKRIRVGLIGHNETLTSCEISFDDSHAVYLPQDRYDYTFEDPIWTFEGASTYTIKRLIGNCEISSQAFYSEAEIDNDIYSNYIPLIRSEAFRDEAPIKLINLDTAFNAQEQYWQDSNVVYADLICGYQNGELRFAIDNSRAVIKSENDEPFYFYNSAYRGGVSFFSAYADGVSFFPINDLDLENYVKGVVPREMPTSWGKEAVKAQAVCARTYAVSSLGNFSDYDYDVAPTVFSQVYGGVSAETENGNEAVEETSHEELFYDGERVGTFFHASNGGFCAASEDVFANPLPYFKPKTDPYSLQITEPWYVIVQPATLQSRMAEEGLYVGQVQYMEILAVNKSRLVEKIRVYGTDGSVEISGGKLRWLLGGNNIQSLYFKFIDDESKIEAETKKKTKGNTDVSVITASGMKEEKIEDIKIIKANGDIEKLSDKEVLYASGLKELPSTEWLAYEGAVEGQTGMIIIGYGWGHNLGLSQWGAKVMAEEGFDYKEILNFYYEGTEIEKN